jgi:hypothetical protein
VCDASRCLVLTRRWAARVLRSGLLSYGEANDDCCPSRKRTDRLVQCVQCAHCIKLCARMLRLARDLFNYGALMSACVTRLFRSSRTVRAGCWGRCAVLGRQPIWAAGAWRRGDAGQGIEGEGQGVSVPRLPLRPVFKGANAPCPALLHRCWRC